VRVDHPKFSVIIPTAGRTTLRRTLRSIRPQAKDDVEVIVVSDGDQPSAERLVREEKWSAVRYFAGPGTHCWGNAQRMEGIKQAIGDYLLFMDDDDVYRRNAFRSLRQATSDSPNRIVIFRMKKFDGTRWQRPVVEWGQVATPQFVVPNIAGKVGSWLTNDRYESDLDFIGETIELQGKPVWDERVIATVEPLDWRNPAPWMRVRGDHWRVWLGIRTRLRRLQ
jgi:glycosyltransferase involved in cell wall biosynthesis